MSFFKKLLRAVIGQLAGGIPAPMLDLNFLSSVLDPRITFTRASTATFIGSNGLIQTAASGVPRFEYDPVSLSPNGLLIEEARTNYIVQSSNYHAFPFTYAVETTTDGYMTAPDGTLSAGRVLETAVLANHLRGIGSNLPCAFDGPRTMSWWVKPIGGKRHFRMECGVVNGAAQSSATRCQFSLIGGVGTLISFLPAGTSAGTGSNFTAQAFADGWYRVSFTLTPAITGILTGSAIFQGMDAAGTTNNYVGVVTEGWAAWGFQYEAGAFPTSYIPTAGAAATRAADRAYMPVISDWASQTEGTLYCDATIGRPAGTLYVAPIVLSDSTVFDNAIAIERNGLASWRYRIRSGAATIATLADIASAPSPTQIRSALAYMAGSQNMAVNGVIGTGTTSALPGATMTQLEIGRRFVGEEICGHIRRFKYWPQRLSNLELQELTEDNPASAAEGTQAARFMLFFEDL